MRLALVGSMHTRCHYVFTEFFWRAVYLMDAQKFSRLYWPDVGVNDNVVSRVSFTFSGCMVTIMLRYLGHETFSSHDVGVG